jgi:hypothetical protein
MSFLNEIGRRFGLNIFEAKQQAWDTKVNAILALCEHLGKGGTLGVEGEEEALERIVAAGGSLGEWGKGIQRIKNQS